jgi:hypothetical protein
MLCEAHREVFFSSNDQVRDEDGDGVQHGGGEEVRASVQGRAGQAVHHGSRTAMRY